MPLLTREEFLATMGEHPTRVGDDADPPLNFWPYVQQIPEADLCGHDFSRGEVPYAWNTCDGKWLHVPIRCPTPNVFLVIVLALTPPAVLGHHLLDLNQHYGLSDPEAPN